MSKIDILKETEQTEDEFTQKEVVFLATIARLLLANTCPSGVDKRGEEIVSKVFRFDTCCAGWMTVHTLENGDPFFIEWEDDDE